MAGPRNARIEVELKCRVSDRKGLGRALKEVGAEFRGTSKQRDTYFSHPGRDFAKTDEALRVREADGKATVTYKGPKFAGATKSRVEMAVDVHDAHALVQILGELGFEPVATVVKRRERYTCEGMEIAVDDVDDVGVYAEIEAVVGEHERAKASDAVMALAKRLALSEVEPRSYLEMLLATREGP